MGNLIAERARQLIESLGLDLPIEFDGSFLPWQETFHFDEFAGPVFKTEDKKIGQRLGAYVFHSHCVVGTHRNLQRGGEVSHAAIEDKLFELRRGVRGRQGIHTQKRCVRVTSGKIMTARTVEWECS